MSPAHIGLLGVVLLFVIAMLEVGIVESAYQKLGMSHRAVTLLLLLSIFGSYINIPVATISPFSPRPILHHQDIYNLSYIPALLPNPDGTIISGQPGRRGNSGVAISVSSNACWRSGASLRRNGSRGAAGPSLRSNSSGRRDCGPYLPSRVRRGHPRDAADARASARGRLCLRDDRLPGGRRCTQSGDDCTPERADSINWRRRHLRRRICLGSNRGAAGVATPRASGLCSVWRTSQALEKVFTACAPL